MINELRFRDGTHVVSDFIAARLQGVNTRFLTYEEAMEQANKREIGDYLNREQHRITREHMMRQR
jgi:hypothetical protein